MTDAFIRTTNLYTIRQYANNLYGRGSRATAAYMEGGSIPMTNRAIEGILAELPVLSLGWYTLTTTAGTRSYSAPPLLELPQLFYARYVEGNDSNPRINLSIMSQTWLDAEREYWRYTTAQGIPTALAYDQPANTIRFDPIPDSSSYTIKILYSRRPSAFTSTATNVSGVKTSFSVVAAQAVSQAPDGAYAVSSVVTFTHPHPVMVTVTGTPAQAFTVTIAGTDQDGTSATEAIALTATANPVGRGTTKWRTITGITWGAAGGSTTATIGDEDQTLSTSTFYCDVPDRFIESLVAARLCRTFAQNDNADDRYQYFDAMYKANLEEAARHLEPHFDIYMRPPDPRFVGNPNPASRSPL